MSYAIIRNRKLTKGKTTGAYVHNERKAKNHSNKNIDPTRTHLNYYIKKNNGTYVEEFKRIKEEQDLKGQIKTTSNITNEMIITSDPAFFNSISYEESQKYFREAYNCISQYKGLGAENIITALVHMDERNTSYASDICTCNSHR